MGINYYWREKPCVTCSHSDKVTHIGKSSWGLVFSFHGTFDCKSWAEWKLVLQSGEGHIFDEDGVPIDTDLFITMVEKKQADKDNRSHAREHPEHSHLDDAGYSFTNVEFS